MSGGGDSSGWTPPSRPQGGTGGGDDCDIFDVTTISSPNASVVKQLAVNDVLEVSLSGASQLAVLYQGKVAGAITSPKMMLFVRCIAEFGNAYVARVLSIDGGQIRIKVYLQ